MRVGIVDFLNSRPLAWGFQRGLFDDAVEVSYHRPSGVADRLESGELDVGLVPSIEALRIPGLTIVPGTCVAATREVRSVLLLLRRPGAEVRRVAADSASRTSVVLSKILFHALWGTEPDFDVRPPVSSGVEDGFDAALLIGDPALRVDREAFEVVDLAAAWRRLTGRPFVFAVWAARRGVDVAELGAIFEKSLLEGRLGLESMVAEAAGELRLPEEDVRSYLTHNLRFELGEEERSGLEEFYRRASALSLVRPATQTSDLLAAV